MRSRQAVKVLVVDDERTVRLFLEKALSEQGYDVTGVASGAEALNRLSTEQFDVVLLDIKLRDMDGLELLATIGQRFPETVRIVFTGHASLETAVKALRYGADDYLTKPLSIEELLRSIATGLERRQREMQRLHFLTALREALESELEGHPPSPGLTPRKRILVRGDLVVDLDRHRVTLEGVCIELSPTEFDILAYLVEHAPRVISPQELVREVQGYESEIWEARDIMRYHIYRIRQKIAKATGRRDIIKTVRGVGYTLGI